MQISIEVNVGKDTILDAAERFFESTAPNLVTPVDVERLERVASMAALLVDRKLGSTGTPQHELKESWKRGVLHRDIDLRRPGVSLSHKAYLRAVEKAKERAKAEGRRVITDHGVFDFSDGDTKDDGDRQ